MVAFLAHADIRAGQASGQRQHCRWRRAVRQWDSRHASLGRTLRASLKKNKKKTRGALVCFVFGAWSLGLTSCVFFSFSIDAIRADRRALSMFFFLRLRAWMMDDDRVLVGSFFTLFASPSQTSHYTHSMTSSPSRPRRFSYMYLTCTRALVIWPHHSHKIENLLR